LDQRALGAAGRPRQVDQLLLDDGADQRLEQPLGDVQRVAAGDRVELDEIGGAGLAVLAGAGDTEGLGHGYSLLTAIAPSGRVNRITRASGISGASSAAAAPSERACSTRARAPNARTLAGSDASARRATPASTTTPLTRTPQ